ncbi:MAG: hypothetical protein IT214_12390 [Chitinophagaceae bacterium]|nr:hypothetical protein [Chitinophagaceae bacterium]
MKKTFSLLFVLPLAFMTNATKNDLPKNGNTHIIKDAKAQVFKAGKPFAKKSLSSAEKKTIKSGFFFDYCLTYEWMWCDNHLSQITHCSTSWQEVYNWMSSAYDTNVFFLEQTCNVPN